ncbi:hypothetical protein I6A60_15330 [Frankia sp. AgB1.9]|uniref:hypothetical protein n=1 Tax=unclassified Frankia TaxID=2632575 RepID=UPI0019348527|nr:MULTISPECIES: hypothetical protein [unclassified Frankia]MBL7494018.1 hypothetical protein [Frankia sp. AgW1.1]MBL7549248.1 hypothetical protein [Frankia sp. AgB1.9]MBL7619465.1 hypothetical protein [Frankia sp. AgB1.8]
MSASATVGHRPATPNPGDSPSYLVVRQTVADIPPWFENFSASTPARRAAGGGDPIVLIEDEEAGQVMVIIPFSSAEAAAAWRSRLGVQQQTAAAGVRTDSVEVRVLRSLSGD